MPDDATVRMRVREIVGELRHAPVITASMLGQEYAKRHGIDGRVRDIAATLLAEMFDPLHPAPRRKG